MSIVLAMQEDCQFPLLDGDVVQAMCLAIRCTSSNPRIKALKDKILKQVDLLRQIKRLKPAEQTGCRPIKLPDEPGMTWSAGIQHIAEKQLPISGVWELAKHVAEETDHVANTKRRTLEDEQATVRSQQNARRKRHLKALAARVSQLSVTPSISDCVR
eukprot:gene2032-2354_t